MSVDIATLGIRIDSSQAATAATDLGNVAAAANDAQVAAGGTKTAFSKAGEELETFARHARNHILAMGGASAETRGFAAVLAHLPPQLLLAGIAVGVLALAYTQGASEANAFAKALAASGGAIGLTASQLGDMATKVGKTAGNTHEAAAALAALVATGEVGKENLQSFATVAVEAQKVLGQTYADTAKQFADLGAKPLDAAVQLNQQIRFLTPALYDQVKALQQQGLFTAAASVAQAGLRDAIQKQTTQVKDYTSIWSRLGTAASKAWDSVQGIGRTQSLQGQLDKLNKDANGRPIGTLIAGGDTTQQLINDHARTALTALIAQQNSQADATAKQTEANKEFIRSLDIENASLQAAIDVGKAFYASQVQDAQRSFGAVQSSIQNQDTILQAQRSAQLLSDKQYFDAKRKLVQSGGAAEVAEIATEISLAKEESAATARRFDLLRRQAATPAERITLDVQQRTQEIADESKLADLEAKRKQSAADTATKVRDLNIQESDAVRQLTQRYADLVVSSDRYTESLQKQYALTLAGAGTGNAARAKAAQQAAITNNIQSQLDANTDEFRNSKGDATAQQKFTETERILKESLAKQQHDFSVYYDNLDLQQGNWVNGARDAFNNYVDGAKNVADQSNVAFTNAFKSIEDSLVALGTTGKFSFHDLANSILADLVRIEVKVLESQALASIFSAFAGVAGGAGSLSGSSGVGEVSGGGGVQYAANGGNPSAGQPFIVGERGPELFVPSQSGTIVPNHKLGGSGVSINSVNNFGPGSDVAALSSELDRRDAQIKSDIQNSIGRGQWNPSLRNARFS